MTHCAFTFVSQCNLASSKFLGYPCQPLHVVRFNTCTLLCLPALYLPARPAAIPDKPHHSQCYHYPPLCRKPPANIESPTVETTILILALFGSI